ncbi:lectin [Pseudoxanthomonas wuyuanensis]
MKVKLPFCALLAVAALSACNQPEPAAPAKPATTASMAEPPPVDVNASPTVPSEPPVVYSQASFLGYGDMKLGSTIDEAKAAWGGELDGAPAEGTSCHYLTPKWVSKPSDFAFMMEEGKFVRYDVGTDKEIAPGGGRVGMSAEELQQMYGGALESTPHKYVEGGQYLSIDASGVAPTKLVFEVDADGRVTAWRVGLLPQADYVEGCS